MNASTGFFAALLATNLRYRSHALDIEVTQMSAGRLRSTRRLRSMSASRPSYRIAGPMPKEPAPTPFRTRAPCRAGKVPRCAAALPPAGHVRGERDRPDTDRVAILEAMVHARGRVIEEPD